MSQSEELVTLKWLPSIISKCTNDVPATSSAGLAGGSVPRREFALLVRWVQLGGSLPDNEIGN